MRYIDLFGGIGGFRLGIERAFKFQNEEYNKREDSSNPSKCNEPWKHNPSCVFYSDIDKYAVQTYNKNFGENWKPTDIRNVPAEQIPKHDVICAGFPCQSFSIAGKRKGFEDTRGTLFFEICRIAKAHQTKFLFLENVKGLLSHDDGKTFDTITKTLNSLGYYVDYKILNSKYFGVPQNRERIFIIGVHIKCLQEFVNDGQKERKNILELIIKPYLSEKLLHLYKEHQKPREIKLKDLDLTSLLLREVISTGLLKKSKLLREILIKLIPNLQSYCKAEQQYLFATKENNWDCSEQDHIGMTLKGVIEKDEMVTEEELNNIEKLWRKCWEENSKDLRGFITSIIKNRIMEERTYTCAEIILITNLFIVTWKELLLNWWKGASLSLIEARGYIIDDKALQFLMGNREERERMFFKRYFGNQCRPKILPFKEDAKEISRISEGERFKIMQQNQQKKIFEKDIAGSIHQSMGNNQSPFVYDRKGFDSRTKGFRENKISPTLSQKMGTGGNNVPMVTGMLPITAIKRKFETPKEINNYLREYKQDKTIREISEYLNLPKTQVEHYFRIDESRAIPTPDIWIKLKDLLKFDDKYDKQVVEFYEKEVEYEMQRRVYSDDGISPTLKTDVPMIQALRNLNRNGPTTSEESAFTVQTSTGGENGVWSEGNLRRLTPIECERLQGYPDDWSKGVSDTQRYKQMGNSVTVNVIQAIAEKLFKNAK